MDGPIRGGHDFRKGRAAAHNTVPETTGAAISVARAIPELAGKFDGLSFRVPTIVGSISDITFLAKRKTSVEEINQILTAAAASPRWQGILKVTTDQLVSSDIIGEPYGATVPLDLTKVIDGDFVKVLSWYDNEAGYVSTLVKHVEKVRIVNINRYPYDHLFRRRSWRIQSEGTSEKCSEKRRLRRRGLRRVRARYGDDYPDFAAAGRHEDWASA